MKRFLLTGLLLWMAGGMVTAQQADNKKPASNRLAVIAYAGSRTPVDSYAVEQLTHILFSFCHLRGDKLAVDNARDSAAIQHLVSLKSRNASLKVMLSLGGWGGCKTCSEVFSTEAQRATFARSVKELMEYFHTDGIDLDWEYPVIAGYPGHPRSPEDKDHFTSLVRQLRDTLGNRYEISFAAGGLSNYLDSSVNWKEVMPEVDRVNLMSYDLINGYSTVTGHHTPLYSTPSQLESTDHAVRFLDSVGVPPGKIAIGMAFYARVFEHVPDHNDGLYQPGRFKMGVAYRNFPSVLSDAQGFTEHWDPVAKAPYKYNADKKLFATFDNSRSIRLKTRYALENGLNGVMFWELGEDTFRNGLLEVIDATLKETGK